MAPGDPVELKLQGGLGGGNSGQSSEKIATEKAYLDLSQKLGRNLPAFYFSVTSSSYPDTLYKIFKKDQRENLEKLIEQYGNWNEISNYFYSAKKLELALYDRKPDNIDTTIFERSRAIREGCNSLYRSYEDRDITFTLSNIKKAAVSEISVLDSATGQVSKYNSLADVIPLVNEVESNYSLMKSKANKTAKFIPAFYWYGKNNQYHRWLFGDVPWFGENTDPTKVSKGFFRGDFGNSYLDGRPVVSILGDALKWTLLLNLIAFFIAYAVSIPMGVSLAVKKDSTYDRVVTAINFVLYSLPTFWIATLLITFFTSDYYADWMDIFPTHGVGKVGDNFTFWEQFTDRSYHFILPIFCMVYGSFAYISRQMRGGMLTVLRQDYIRTAFAKGLDPSKVYWKHAFRNSLIPIITMFASFLPAMISGSVIIEYIFTIPGMGRISFESVVARNFPVLFTLLMFSAILTMIGNLLSDILYGVIDPRISFTKKK
ncbi:MAG TPA: ABC transporter permease [Chitinophagales bacterium]|nr:ABC transporter permease [Chitinophagales bacterium]